MTWKGSFGRGTSVLSGSRIPVKYPGSCLPCFIRHQFRPFVCNAGTCGCWLSLSVRTPFCSRVVEIGRSRCRSLEKTISQKYSLPTWIDFPHIFDLHLLQHWILLYWAAFCFDPLLSWFIREQLIPFLLKRTHDIGKNLPIQLVHLGTTIASSQSFSLIPTRLRNLTASLVLLVFYAPRKHWELG